MSKQQQNKQQQQQQQQQMQLADVLDNSISSKCQCGMIEIQFPVSAVVVCPIPILLSSNNATSTCNTTTTTTTTTAAVDCHCSSCRRYHIAAFASYVIVLKSNITIIDNIHNNKRPKLLLNGTETSMSQKLSLLSTKDDDKSYETYNDTCSGIHIRNNNIIINNNTTTATQQQQQQQQTQVNVKRIYCKYCSTKLYTEIITVKDEPNNKRQLQQQQSTILSETIVLVNMGPLQDTTIPKVLSNQWKRLSTASINNISSGRQQWAINETAVWTWAIPEYVQQKQQRNSKKETKNNEKLLLLKGGCTCKLYQYEINFDNIPSTELQHCYCQLCRRLSGSAFMTWISIYCKDFKWIIKDNNNCSSKNLLKRYTDHGQRHVCTNCHGAMTIVYDKDITTPATKDIDDDAEEEKDDDDDDDEWEDETDDEDDDDENVIWIAAGSLDTNFLPPPTTTTKYDMNKHIERVAHICCSMRQSWYTLPEDGMERINDAS